MFQLLDSFGYYSHFIEGWWMVYDFLLQFQSLIVGFIGFSGVVATLIVNARIQRIQKENDRTERMKSIRTALSSELSIISEAIEGNVSKIKDGPDEEYQSLLIPTNRMDSVFQSMISDLGNLSPPEVKDVLFAYLTYDTFLSSITLLGVTSEAHPNHAIMPADQSQNLKVMLVSLNEDIKKAITRLDQKLADPSAKLVWWKVYDGKSRSRIS